MEVRETQLQKGGPLIGPKPASQMGPTHSVYQPIGISPQMADLLCPTHGQSAHWNNYVRETVVKKKKRFHFYIRIRFRNQILNLPT